MLTCTLDAGIGPTHWCANTVSNLDLYGLEQGAPGWSTYMSPYIQQNQQAIIEESHRLHQAHQQAFVNSDSTWNYEHYNIFSLAAGNVYYYNIFQQVRQLCRDTVGRDQPMWLLAWLNYHDANEVLDWHDHWHSAVHGYISIDPKDTYTEFEQFSVDNEVGKIYLGPCRLRHRVVVRQPWSGPRITLAFQAVTPETLPKNIGYDFVNINSRIPI